MTYGASFSVKYAKELNLPWEEVYKSLIQDLGIKRFRLMSYWDLLEPRPGEFDFKDLDWQFNYAREHNVKITLAIGLRQPRYPECHIPGWAKVLGNAKLTLVLCNYLEAVVKRYAKYPNLISWQLENEALNKGIGTCINYDRLRLRQEYNLVKELDPKHPIIMSTCNGWGLPARRPIPDIIGFSLYLTQYKNGYSRKHFPPEPHKLHSWIVKYLYRRQTIIHELQAEPWGPRATKDLDLHEQFESMNPEIFKQEIDYAKATSIDYVDLWGAEWWYWLKEKGDSSMWQVAKRLYK